MGAGVDFGFGFGLNLGVDEAALFDDAAAEDDEEGVERVLTILAEAGSKSRNGRVVRDGMMVSKVVKGTQV